MLSELQQFKPLIKSRTFWGVLASVVGKIGAILGYEIGVDEEEALVSTISLGISFVGDAIALVGRVKATKRIGM